MNNITSDLILLAAGFIGGVVTAYSQGWVKDHFQKKAEKRASIEKFMGKVTDTIADATASGYKDFPDGVIKSKMNKAAAQLERLDRKVTAYNIRSYMNKWTEFNDLTLTWDGSWKKVYDEKRAVQLRQELDDLTDALLN